MSDPGKKLLAVGASLVRAKRVETSPAIEFALTGIPGMRCTDRLGRHRPASRSLAISPESLPASVLPAGPDGTTHQHSRKAQRLSLRIDPRRGLHISIKNTYCRDEIFLLNRSDEPDARASLASPLDRRSTSTISAVRTAWRPLRSGRPAVNASSKEHAWSSPSAAALSRPWSLHSADGTPFVVNWVAAAWRRSTSPTMPSAISS